MRQRWEDVAFLHWPVARDIVEGLIHPDLEADTRDGSAWVGLVPFRMVGISLPAGPPIPYAGTFAETNVRTYVNGPRGPGVWFHSLEAARLLPMLAARVGYRLPYFHAAMQIKAHGNQMVYNTIRRWPGPRGAGGIVHMEVGAATDPSELDVFLTARWRLYTSRGGRLYSAEVRHPEWQLRSSTVMAWDDELVRVAGYPLAEDEPRALFSPGVPVTVYPPERIT
jgi:uncharacterized protein YqjF (DUF2071 family)